MLKNKNILCVSNTTWFGTYTKSTVQLLSLLAKDNQVLFVEYPYTIKDLFDGILKKKKVPVARMLGFKNRLQKITVDKNTSVYQLILPPMLPFAFAKNRRLFSGLLKVNAWVYAKVANSYLKKLNFKERTVINAYNPLYGYYLLGKLKEERTAYYCYDITETHRYGQHIVHFEEAFTKKVGLVITSSAPLNKKKRIHNPQSFTVTNGVDFELFAPYSKNKVHSATQKIVGYVGSLDNRFDIDTMEYVVKNAPEVRFEFTGNVRNKAIVERLGSFSNVAFNQPIPAAQVPELMASFDVGIIPYKMNEQNKNIYPLKINEYLAIGLPVVITAFADLPEFKSVIHTASKATIFLDQCLGALENDSKTQIKARIEFAKKQSWESKANTFGNLIAAQFPHEKTSLQHQKLSYASS